MRGRNSKAEPGDRGGTAWNDGIYSVDGGSNGDVPSFIATTEDDDDGLGRGTRNGNDAVAEKAWFAPVDDTAFSLNDAAFDFSIFPGFSSECKDGVCPVPWAVKEEAPLVQSDQVNHPPHYTDGGIECIEAIEAALTDEEFRGYCKGNLIKYGWRERMKGGTESLKKAQWYLDRLIQFDEAQNG
jgi:hypothetical protein